MQAPYQNWQLNLVDDVAWLYFNRAEQSTNTLNEAALDELKSIVLNLSLEKTTKGLIITSAKKNGFIAGADIRDISHFDTHQTVLNFIQKGQEVFAQLNNLKIPTIALIDGFCLGGGLELALACKYRIATDNIKTRLGLPEILLGLHPGWGGTVRLPRLIGGTRALELILTGRTVSGKTAAKMALVDAVVPARDLERAAIHFITKQPKMRSANWLQGLTNHTLIRPAIAKMLRRQLMQKILPEHYPAPFAVIEHWEKEGVESAQAFVAEAESLADIALSDATRNLLRVYFLRERLKRLGKEEFATQAEFATQKVQHVHVIGAGTMGGGIAAWCALQGMHVSLQDREPKLIEPAIQRAYELFQKKLKSKRDIQAAMDRLMPDVQGYGLARADIVIEAIFENLEAKQILFKQIEQRCKADAILATNTSSISLDEINTVLKQPERLVGIHFFNPVALMQLVEVVKGPITDSAIVNKAIAFVRQIDHLPLPVKSSPGFLINRVLMPYLLAAIKLWEKGVPAALIDKAAVKFGMPMGPIHLADVVGLDVCLAVLKELSRHFDSSIPNCLESMVAKGELGRKTGKGFYTYQQGKPVKEKCRNDDKPVIDIIDYLIQPMIEEAEKCLQEAVVADSDLLDAGMIFATGFAPFRGGLLHYATEQQK